MREVSVCQSFSKVKSNSEIRRRFTHTEGQHVDSQVRKLEVFSNPLKLIGYSFPGLQNKSQLNPVSMLGKRKRQAPVESLMRWTYALRCNFSLKGRQKERDSFDTKNFLSKGKNFGTLLSIGTKERI